ncbi:MFS transporter [Nocardioides sp.]|uniref:MFS transporter n=1 Tax=Nocardioides sp. TaxID=35761 RepID=UPI002C2FC9B9|nr:MFS transporter [Nocardioides sp.]HSX65893.1 MFS transporter [Nocardioides sp.]
MSSTLSSTGARRAQVVLAGVVALQLIAETALTPYWPLLFRRLFGVEELAATGSYLAICRVAGLAALPLWGLAALRWPVRTLLVTGLLLSAVFDLSLALAPTWWSFAGFSAGVVASGSVLVLAYPALIAVTERPDTTDRRTGVVTFWAVFHVAAILATLVGAGIVGLDQPRWGLAAFALVDVLLAVAVLSLVPAEPVRRRVDAGDALSGDHPAATVAAEPHLAGVTRWRRLRPWLVLVAAVVAVDAALAVPRPYFVELLVRQGVDASAAGWLFLAPAVASLAMLPFASFLMDRLGRATAVVGALLGAGGLLAQALAAAADAELALLAGRLAFGAGAGLLLVVLDLAVFDRIGTGGAAFSAIETGRSAALFAAPIVATAVAGAWLGAPLLAGAVLLLAAAALLALARITMPDREQRPRPSTPSPTQETEHVLDPVH